MLRFFRITTLLICLSIGPLLLAWVLSKGETMYFWFLLVGAVIWPVVLMFWYLAFGKSPFLKRLKRFGIFFTILIVLGFAAGKTLRYEGSTSGASMPKFSWKWTKKEAPGKVEVKLSSSSVAKDPSIKTTASNSAQFLGPNRDGAWPELNFSPDWKSNPPKEIWRRSVGQGWSGFAVFGNQAITQEQFGTSECVVCYDLFSGKQLWIHRDENAGYLNANPENKGAIMGGAGPRSTPTIHGGKVYTQGAGGIVNCLNLETGKLIWSRNPISEHKGKIPMWGQSSAPLVIENLNAVVVSGSEKSGSTLLAYRLESGEPIWNYKGGGASYSSPRLLTLQGTRQIVSVNAKDLSGVDPDTGKELWKYDWPGFNPKVAQPFKIGKNQILVTASYGAGSHLVEVDQGGEKWTATRKWKSVKIKTKFSSVSVKDGLAYGLDEGRLTCIDLANGKRVWKKQKFGFGQQLLIGGHHLLVQAEAGYVVIGKISPDEFVETGRIEALSSMTWNTPTLAGRLLLVRNDKEAVCYLLSE